MTIKTKILFLFLFLSFRLAIGQGTWTKKADIPDVGRCGAYCFSIGTKGYFGFGIDTTGMKNDFWEWDRSTNVWTQKASLPDLPRRNGISFSIGTKGYICVGNSASPTTYRQTWEYNPATDIWVRKADYPGDCIDASVGFSIGSKGYIGVCDWYKDFYEFDPINDTWTKKADFGGAPRYGAQGFSIGSKGYIGGGVHSTPYASFKDFWEYDQITDTWTQKADLPENRCTAAGFSVCGKGYFCAGGNNDIPTHLNDLIEFDPITNSWTQKAPLPSTVRCQTISFSIGNKGFVGLGCKLTPPWSAKDFWEYTPEQLCDDTLNTPIDTIIIHPDNNNIIFIPNIFSPNNDGSNDVLYVRGENIKELILSIYNRWGEKVFETQDKKIGWDGKYKNKDCETGVYLYVANITFTNGETVFKKGNVTLVR